MIVQAHINDGLNAALREKIEKLLWPPAAISDCVDEHTSPPSRPAVRPGILPQTYDAAMTALRSGGRMPESYQRLVPQRASSRTDATSECRRATVTGGMVRSRPLQSHDRMEIVMKTSIIRVCGSSLPCRPFVSTTAVQDRVDIRDVLGSAPSFDSVGITPLLPAFIRSIVSRSASASACSRV